jgi:hypothetical protein
VWIQELLEVHYPHARKIRLVMDNLNTHSISSLYETFLPAVALKRAKRLEIHFTPKHGSWLDIAEIELSAMTEATRPLDKIHDLRHCSAIILRVYIKAMEAQYGTKHSRTDEQVSD